MPETTSLIPPEIDLQSAANDVYEAVVEDEEEYNEDSHDEDVVWLREQRTLNKSLHWLKRPSVLMVALITFLLAFAASSGESSRQVISYKLACNYLTLDSGSCDPTQTQVLVSNLQLAYSTSSAIFMLIALGKVGPLSDQYGRKPFIVLIILFMFMGKLTKFLTMYNFDKLKFGLMLSSEILTNLCGGILTLLTLANCYISDVSEPHHRIYSLGLSIASMFTGLSIGPVVGNLVLSLAKSWYPSEESQIAAIDTSVAVSKAEFVPLKFELVTIFLLLIFGFFVLPESRSERARTKSRSLSVSLSVLLALELDLSQPKPSFLSSINFLRPLKLLYLPSEFVANKAKLTSHRIVVLSLIFMECFIASMSVAMGEIYILYGIYTFNWDQHDIGRFLAVSCSIRAVVLIVLSPVINHQLIQRKLRFRPMKKQFDMVDFSMVLIGFVLEFIGLNLFFVAPSSASFLSIMLITSFGTLLIPSLSSSIIKFYPESMVGEVFGAMALMKNLFSLASPFVIITIYKYSLSHWNLPGVPFLVFGEAMGVATIMLLICKRLLNLTRDSVPELLTRRVSTALLNKSVLRESS